LPCTFPVPGAGFTFSTPVSSVAFVADEFVDDVDFLPSLQLEDITTNKATTVTSILLTGIYL